MTATHLRLVKGSHIIVPKWHDGEHAFFFQNADGRIMFAIPYERGEYHADRYDRHSVHRRQGQG
jgi:glycerol-3-phosphate dehydrogenase